MEPALGAQYMTANIRGTSLKHYDHQGGAVTDLVTSIGNFGAQHRAFTQSDKNAMLPATRAKPVIPSRVAVYAARLDGSAIRTLAGNPGIIAEKANDGVFTRVGNLKLNSLGIFAGQTPAEEVWDDRFDSLWMHAGSGTRSVVTALVARRPETRYSLEQRLRTGYGLRIRAPDDAKRHIAPVLRLDSPKFIDVFDYVLERELEIVGLEVHGLTRARANLAYVHAALDKAAVPPWLFALNVPRYHDEGHGSGTLMVARYGIQAVSQRIFYGNPLGDDPSREPSKPEETWWFDSSRGGYERLGRLPNIEQGCPCPNGKALQAPDLAALLSARRRHETWMHMADQPNYVRNVANQTYTDYMTDRQGLKLSLKSLP